IFDCATKSFDSAEETQPRRVGSEEITYPSDKECCQVLPREGAAALSTIFTANHAALQGMHVFEGITCIKVEDRECKARAPNTAGLSAPQQGLEMVRAVIEMPSLIVDRLPFGRAHSRVGCDRMLDVVVVEI